MEPAAWETDRIVVLRSTGWSFIRIAHVMGYDDIGQAERGFLVGLRQRSSAEQSRLRYQELRRLEQQTQALEDRTDLDPAQRLRGITRLDQLRAALIQR